MVYQEPCKEVRRRISAAIHGWDRPLQTFIYPGFDCGSLGGSQRPNKSKFSCLLKFARWPAGSAATSSLERYKTVRYSHILTGLPPHPQGPKHPALCPNNPFLGLLPRAWCWPRKKRESEAESRDPLEWAVLFFFHGAAFQSSPLGSWEATNQKRTPVRTAQNVHQTPIPKCLQDAAVQHMSIPGRVGQLDGGLLSKREPRAQGKASAKKTELDMPT